MPAETPEEALERLREMDTPEVLETFEQEIESQIEQRRKLSERAQIEIHAYNGVLRMVQAMRGHLQTPVSDTENDTEASGDSETLMESSISPEVAERLEKGLCTHKQFRGKWCARKLRTKAEKASGYCRTHMDELGIEPPPEKKSQKSVKKARKKTRKKKSEE